MRADTMIRQETNLILEDALQTPPSQPAEDADRLLVQALIMEKVLTPQAVAPLLTRRRAGEPQLLLQMLVSEQIAKLEDLLVAIVRRSGLPYLPLAQYNVYEDVVRLLPARFCARHGLVPFDRLGRAVLVATTNPFDQRTREEVNDMLDCRVFWLVSAPAEIAAVLDRGHRLAETARNA